MVKLRMSVGLVATAALLGACHLGVPHDPGSTTTTSSSTTSTSTTTSSTTTTSTLPPQTYTWDLAGDFADSPDEANPSADAYGNADVWSYRFGASPAGTLMPVAETGACGTADGLAWRENPGTVPYVYRNSDDVAGTCVPGQLPPGHVMVQPSGSDVLVGWTSPFSGVATITGSVTPVDGTCGDGIDWAISLGTGSPIASGGPVITAPQAFSSGAGGADLSTVTVSAGDTIYLDIDARGDSTCDPMDVALTITMTV